MHRSFAQPAQHITHSTVDSHTHMHTHQHTHSQRHTVHANTAYGKGCAAERGATQRLGLHTSPTVRCRCRSRRQAQQVHVTLSRRVAQSLRRRVGQQQKQKQKLKHQATATCRPGRALVPECLPATTIAHTHTQAHRHTYTHTWHALISVAEWACLCVCMCVCVNWQSQRNCSVSWQRTQRGSQSSLAKPQEQQHSGASQFKCPPNQNSFFLCTLLIYNIFYYFKFKLLFIG